MRRRRRATSRCARSRTRARRSSDALRVRSDRLLACQRLSGRHLPACCSRPGASAGFQVHAIERIGHDPRLPVTSNWPHLRDELDPLHRARGRRPGLPGRPFARAAAERAGRQPAARSGPRPRDARFAAHHRLARPWPAGVQGDRPRRPLVARQGVAAPAVRVAVARGRARALRVASRLRALGSRACCATTSAAGFEERGGRTGLAFEREIETRIYNTLPHHFARVLRAPPAAVPGGVHRRHAVGRDAARQASRPRAGSRKERFAWIEGSHLFPMEKPDATAAEVLRLTRHDGLTGRTPLL